MVDQAEIHRRALSGNPEDRNDAVHQLEVSFAALPYKAAAWQDLIRLTSDDDSFVRWNAADALGSAFADAPDKVAAWQDLHRLTSDDDSYVRRGATIALGLAFADVPDKVAAWQDLHRLTGDDDSYVQWSAAYTLGSAFADVPDKVAAWQDLHRLISDDDSYVRWRAARALGLAFAEVPDQAAAWQDLHRLTSDDDNNVRRGAADALGLAFAEVPDQAAAWQDLHRLTSDDDGYVRGRAADALGLAFAEVPDQAAAWQDLHRLTSDDDGYVRWSAAVALGSAFAGVPDKVAAWQDLHRLTGDDDGYVQGRAADALGSAFAGVPDKVAAWQDLHHLSGDDDGYVRWGAAGALGSAFADVPDKVAAWQDLHHLSGDDDHNVRVSANHSLGKASIFKATKAEGEEDFGRELENALGFFEKSAKEAKYSNPAKFCLPFYRSFYVLTCKSEGSEAEVEKYLKEAKWASKGSKSKKELLEAVENLSTALKEAQRLHETNLNGVKSDLKAYMQYCNRAAELLDNAEERAPGATKLVRRGLPIIDRQIKALLREIEEEGSRLRKATRDTPFEPLGERTGERSQGLAKVEQQDEAMRIMDETVPDIRVMCNFLPERSRASVCELQDWDELDFERKVSLFKSAISRCSLWMEVLSQQIVEKDGWIEYLKDEVIGRLKNINYNIFRLKIHSADAADSLRALKWELDRVKAIKSDVDRLGRKVENLGVSQQQVLLELEEQMPRIIVELEMLAIDRDDPMIPKILEKLDELKRSRGETVFERASGLASIVGLLLALAL